MYTVTILGRDRRYTVKGLSAAIELAIYFHETLDKRVGIDVINALTGEVCLILGDNSMPYATPSISEL